MTIAAPESPERDSSDLEPGAVVRPVVRQRSARQRRRRRKLLLFQGGATVVFVVLLVALAVLGWNTALRITGGDANEVTDPDAPGYVASARPTTVSLIAFTGDQVPPPTTTTVADPADPADPAATADTAPAGEAAVPSLATMLLVIERSGDLGRSVVPIPALTTLWSFEDSVPASAEDVFASGGIDVLRLRLGAELTFGTTAAFTAPASMIDDLAGAVGPVTVSLPDDVLQAGAGDDATVKYPAGQLTLGPGEVAEFMSFAGLDESEANKALRQQLVWEALFGAAPETPGELELAADGEDQERAAEVLAAAATPTTRFDLVPMSGIPLFVAPPKTIYRIDQAAMPTWVASEVPFPIAAFPGQRARVELLNGTRDDTALRQVAPLVVGANGEISFTGNAESFDVATSIVEYSAEEASDAADAIAAALGTVATRSSDAATNVDVVVVVGADQISQG